VLRGDSVTEIGKGSRPRRSTGLASVVLHHHHRRANRPHLCGSAALTAKNCACRAERAHAYPLRGIETELRRRKTPRTAQSRDSRGTRTRATSSISTSSQTGLDLHQGNAAKRQTVLNVFE